MKSATGRCAWAAGDPLMEAYHDTEWGVPLRDDTKLFEFLVLEGMQAGLSWRTVLYKRENFREAFDGFDPELVARYTPRRVEKLMQNAGIIRNRAKIEATVGNARAFLRVQEADGGFAAFSWRFVGGKPRVNRWTAMRQIPAVTPEAEAFSKELKARGFRFVGPTVVYAHMQATGMVNDHTTDCFRHKQVGRIPGRRPA